MKKSIMTPEWVSEKLPKPSHVDGEGNMSFYLGNQTNASLIELELDKLNISYGTFEFNDDCEEATFGFEFRINDIQGNCPTLYNTLKELGINNFNNKNHKKVNPMKNYRKTVIHSKNRNSKNHNSKSKISAESNHDIFFPEFEKKYRCNPFWEYLITINNSLFENLNNVFVELDNKVEIVDTYRLLVSPNNSYFVDIKDIKDVETYKNMILVAYYSQFAKFGINLSIVEDENPELRGLSDFLLQESSETYIAYCELSNQFGFNTSGHLRNKNFSLEDEPITDSIHAVLKTDSGDLLIQQNDSLFPFFLICIGLGHRIKSEKNESHQIDDILSTFSNLMGSKCTYSLDSEGYICFMLDDNEDFRESNESGLVIMLGIFSCFKLNLEFLEYQNPELMGINALLSNEYPGVYNAYRTLTNEFGFEGTVKLGLNPTASDDEIVTFLQNLKVEKWNGELTIEDKVVLEEEVSGNICTGSLNENDVADSTSRNTNAK